MHDPLLFLLHNKSSCVRHHTVHVPRWNIWCSLGRIWQSFAN